ncbi:MAG: AAA family ATPase [Mogibacterium sp.]|nr:AAA family ATPase [Mogibacterium sp.]
MSKENLEKIMDALPEEEQHRLSEQAAQPLKGKNTIPVLNPITAKDLQEKKMPPLVWVVDDILPVGVCVLAAKPKRGKSFFALDLCLSVCNGFDFLGYKTHPGACLYFDIESGQRRPKDRLEKMLKGKLAPANLYIVTMEELENSEHEAGKALKIGSGFEILLDGFLNDHQEIKLVVIDILARARQGKKNKEDDYERDYRDFGELIRIANNHKVCVMCVMHNTKTEHSDPFDDIQGSAGVMGSLDTAMVIQRTNTEDNDSTLYIRGRDIEEQALVMSFDNGKWIRRGTQEEVERQQLETEYKGSPIIQTIEALLKDQSEWKGTPKELITESIYKGTHIGYSPKKTGEEIGRFWSMLERDYLARYLGHKTKGNTYLFKRK